MRTGYDLCAAPIGSQGLPRGKGLFGPRVRVLALDPGSLTRYFNI